MGLFIFRLMLGNIKKSVRDKKLIVLKFNALRTKQANSTGSYGTELIERCQIV